MKKILIVTLLAFSAFHVKAQTKPVDTAACSIVIGIQQKAIQLISSSDIPAIKADEIRQQLQGVIQYFTQQRQYLVEESKKKKVAPATNKN